MSIPGMIDGSRRTMFSGNGPFTIVNKTILKRYPLPSYAKYPVRELEGDLIEGEGAPELCPVEYLRHMISITHLNHFR